MKSATAPFIPASLPKMPTFISKFTSTGGIVYFCNVSYIGSKISSPAREMPPLITIHSGFIIFKRFPIPKAK